MTEAPIRINSFQQPFSIKIIDESNRLSLVGYHQNIEIFLTLSMLVLPTKIQSGYSIICGPWLRKHWKSFIYHHILKVIYFLINIFVCISSRLLPNKVKKGKSSSVVHFIFE